MPAAVAGVEWETGSEPASCTLGQAACYCWAGSGHLEASLICPAVCFGLVSLLRRSDVSQASASLSLDLPHTALANLGI